MCSITVAAVPFFRPRGRSHPRRQVRIIRGMRIDRGTLAGSTGLGSMVHRARWKIPVNKRHAVWSGLGAAAVFAAIAGAWMLSLPAVRRVGLAPPIGKDEDDATIEALKPPKRKRPLIAIVGANGGTEVTDYL